ncbi:7TM diverse intracellular signaling domain-containing protein [Pedobacter nyackensis]|uniref:sensor histidine kinase n=1 Tax=Pedobacter nyackensis TaxID=475255 RepID=UPI00292D5CDD|nr:7TM diverse intracellular signaling domain-containing protein [Pedobacter nyackensis]
MKIIYFLSFILVHVLSFAYGQDKLEVDAKYAIDTNSSWNITTVKSKKLQSFDQGEQLDIGYNKNSSVWCHFRIKNTDNSSPANAWLSFDNCHIDSLIKYEEMKPVVILGDRTANRSPFLTALALSLKLNPGEEKVFYIRVKKEISALTFSYQLTDADALARKSDLKIAVVSFFVGIVFLLILFNTLLLAISRKRLFLYYILYSILSIVYILISANYAKHVLFPEFLYYSEFRMYASCLWIVAICAFLSNYLNLRKYEPVKYKIVVGANTMNIFIMVLTLIFFALDKRGALKIPMLIGYFNFLIAIVLVYWSTILHLKINKPAAIYVIIAFFPQIVWGVCSILKFFSWIPTDLHTDWLMYICLYEALLFGYVLTKNYIDTFQKNNNLIKEIIFEKERSLQAITQVQIRERRSIANIIHDNFGSKLAYILQLIQLKNIRLAEENIKVLTSDIREISHRILPKSLDEGALISSLNSQIFSLNTGLPNAKIDLFVYDFPEKLDAVWIYDLYLIALEIINNALKHGAAQSIILELYGYPDAYVFQFSDDGKGFDLNEVVKGFGLENIEKRVKYYKGEFEINSRPGEGTVIQITIPNQ